MRARASPAADALIGVARRGRAGDYCGARGRARADGGQRDMPGARARARLAPHRARSRDPPTPLHTVMPHTHCRCADVVPRRSLPVRGMCADLAGGTHEGVDEESQDLRPLSQGAHACPSPDSRGHFRRCTPRIPAVPILPFGDQGVHRHARGDPDVSLGPRASPSPATGRRAARRRCEHRRRRPEQWCLRSRRVRGAAPPAFAPSAVRAAARDGGAGRHAGVGRAHARRLPPPRAWA